MAWGMRPFFCGEKVFQAGLIQNFLLTHSFTFSAGGIPLCHGAGGWPRITGSAPVRRVQRDDWLGFCNFGRFFWRRHRFRFKPAAHGCAGGLLVFAGSQLTLTIMDLEGRREFFIATLILGITLASNLAAGFIAGMIVAWILQWEKLTV